jgi:hypothetical protein
MNLLSHYYASCKEGRPYYNFGLVLPDFLGMSNREWKPIRFIESSDQALMDIASGCKEHLRVDSVFHSLKEFKDNVLYIRKKIEESGMRINGMRLFFTAHVLFEIILDRIILIREMKFADKFYSDLTEIDTGAISHLFSANGIGSSGKFLISFEKFKTHRYIYHYIDSGKVMFALNRIMLRAGLIVFEENELGKFENVIFDVETHISPQFLSIFEAVKNKWQPL